MDVKLFEVLGKVAGLAGLSLGIAFLVFRAILKKDIFPKLNTIQAYRLLTQLMYLTFTLAVIGIFVWQLGKRNHTLTGHVTDASTKKPVADAEITLSGRPESARTDGAGNFSLVIVEPLPSESVHLFVSKEAYGQFDRQAYLGQNLEAELTPLKLPVDPPREVTAEEVYYSDDVASGHCKDFGAWASLCTPDKPSGWTIVSQHFELTGDRAGGAFAESGPLGIPTEYKACYHFRTQGHEEECGHSGNTGIHYSKGVLRVVWKHP